MMQPPWGGKYQRPYYNWHCCTYPWQHLSPAAEDHFGLCIPHSDVSINWWRQGDPEVDHHWHHALAVCRTLWLQEACVSSVPSPAAGFSPLLSLLLWNSFWLRLHAIQVNVSTVNKFLLWAKQCWELWTDETESVSSRTFQARVDISSAAFGLLNTFWWVQLAVRCVISNLFLIIEYQVGWHVFEIHLGLFL